MGLLSSQLSTKTMVLLCRQMATAYEAGIPILRSLDMVSRNFRDQRTRGILKRMSTNIQQGESLGTAARAEQEYLPTFFVELLSSGEMGGKLDVMLRDLADYYETRQDMKRRVIGAMVYPCIQLIAAWFLGTFSLRLISRLNFTTGSFNLGAFFNDYLRFQGIAMITFGAVVFTCLLLGRAGVFKYIWCYFTTFIWPFKPITVRFGLARFFRSFSLLLVSGMPIRDCVTRAAATVNNPYIEKDIMGALPAILKGSSLSEAFASSKFLTPVAREMLYVGEQSGRVDVTLQKVANYHMAEATHALQVGTRIMEIVIGLVVAGIVGYVVISFWSNYYGRMMNGLGI